MSSRIVSAVCVSLAVLLESASVFAQFVEPTKVLPPPAQKTTASGRLAPIQTRGTDRQPVAQSKIELLGPKPPTQVNRVSPRATPLSLDESPVSDSQSPIDEVFSPWLSTPSADWFALAPKDSSISWEPASVKRTSFDQPATTNANSWQQKPKASFDTAPPASQSHSWDGPRDSRPKGSKAGWK